MSSNSPLPVSRARGPEFSWRLAFLALFVACSAPAPPPENSVAPSDGLSPSQRLYIVGVDREMPPYSYVDKDGNPAGFTIELMQGVAEVMEFDLEFRPGSSAELIAGLADGSIDILPHLSLSNELERRFLFTLPITATQDAIFVRRGTTDVASESDLAGKSIIVAEDDPAYDYVQEGGFAGEILREASISDVLRRLAAGEGQCALAPERVGKTLVDKLGLSNLASVARPIEGFQRRIGFAVRNEDRELQGRLEQGLTIITANGLYQQLYNDWLVDEDNAQVLRRMLFVLVPVLLLLLVSAAWSWSLRETVARRTAELERAQEALAASERKYRGLFDSSIDAIALFNVEGQWLDANPACLKMLDYDLEALQSRTKQELTPPHWRRQEQHVLVTQVARQGFSEEYEKEMVRKNGEVFSVSVRTWLVEDDAGQPLGYWSILRDLTEKKMAEEEKKKLEAQILQTQKLESLGVLAGGIAHDFNNLLMGILGNAGLALLELPAESTVRDRLRDVEKAGRRAAELCKQMLAYSGKGKFVVMPVDLSQLVADMAHLLEVSISKKAVLQYDFAANIPTFEADATQIRQVVMNLITNASDALGEEIGTILIRTGVMDCSPEYLQHTFLAEKLRAGTYVYLEVTDTGCGMDPETQERIFDPFFSTKFTGRGLGLAATLGIVRGHKGAIEVESTPGKGTTFRVLLPCSTKPVVPRQEDTASRDPSFVGEGTVLVVDDEEMVLSVARRVLERAGYNVLTARDGQTGFDIFRNHLLEISVVLLDATMPRMDGQEAFRRMSRVKPGVRVILSSGYNEQDATGDFSDQGLAGFIQKPYSPAELLKKIRQAQTSGRPAVVS